MQVSDRAGDPSCLCAAIRRRVVSSRGVGGIDVIAVRLGVRSSLSGGLSSLVPLCWRGGGLCRFWDSLFFVDKALAALRHPVYGLLRLEIVYGDSQGAAVASDDSHDEDERDKTARNLPRNATVGGTRRRKTREHETQRVTSASSCITIRLNDKSSSLIRETSQDRLEEV